MKFYIASKLENYGQVKYLAAKLKSSGWIHTYDWTAHGSVKASSVEILKKVAQMEYNGVKDADVVIVLTPQGRGTHTELGMAMYQRSDFYVLYKNDIYT